MGFYAVSTMPLSKPDSRASLKKIFYADDGSGGGKLDGLLDWWKELKENGPYLDTSLRPQRPGC